jgi:hypothetical protein
MRDFDLGLILWGLFFMILGGVFGIWFFFCLQSPASPLHIPLLPGAVGSLYRWTIGLGVLLVLVGILTGYFLLKRETRVLSSLFIFGVWVKVFGLFLGAIWSVPGIEVIQVYIKGIIVLSFRVIGNIILLSGLIFLFWTLYSKTKK